MNLTPRQQQVLDFLVDQQQSTGITPSTREIQQHFGFASQTAAVQHLRALERKGAIRRHAGKARAMELHPGSVRRHLVDVPLIGRIAAGFSTEGMQEAEGTVTVDVTAVGLGRNAKTFALKVRGDSMTGAHILDGDTVVLEIREPREGDIVAALIDGETSLKRLVRKNGQAFLKAENPTYPDLIPVQKLEVQGVMVALLRGRTGVQAPKKKSFQSGAVRA